MATVPPIGAFRTMAISEKMMLEHNIEFARYRRDERLGHIALNVAQAHDKLARIELDDRRILRDEFFDLAEIGGRVDEALGDVPLGLAKMLNTSPDSTTLPCSITATRVTDLP